MNKKLGLSVIIITRNEEADLQGCLESVAEIADEIVLVDSGSTDRTLDIAKKFSARIFHKNWEGYSAQKQEALQQAKGPWVLNIDADERVTTHLRKEITAVLSGENEFAGFHIPFRQFFLGRQLRFGGVQGEMHLRLFRKDAAVYGQEKVHEGIRVNPPVGHLKNVIDHTSYASIEEYLNKCNRYTSLIAEKKYRQGQRFHFWHHFRLPLELVIRLVVKLGFLDGARGVTWGVLSSFYVWLKYLKLLDYEEKK